VPALSRPAREAAMAATIYHWGLHPWAIYAVLGLSLALAAYNKGMPLSVRSAFYPIFGERVRGWIGHVIDIMAVFATLFGLATSLGFGAEQALAGLNFLYGVPVTDTMKVLLIAGITAIALGSVVAGLDAGVKRLSEINMVLAVLLVAFVFALGPTGEIVAGFFSNTWSYVTHLPALSNPFGRTDDEFLHGWTTFYWGVVDLLVAICRHVHRPYIERSHSARIHRLRAAHSDGRIDLLDDSLWRHGAFAIPERWLSGRAGDRRGLHA
jgi:BCCT family betaine/carnitine transporter